MTTLVLQTADALVGGLAGAATSLAGRAIAGLLAGDGGGGGGVRTVEGPRLSAMQGLAATEGAPIPRVYGRARVGGQLIWTTRFEEVATTTTTLDRQPRRGGKGFGGRAPASSTSTTTYSYYANLAVGLCEGPIAFVRRIWADGRELDQTNLTIRLHPGDEAQAPDPLIVAKEGAENAPAYRGLAYLVFERLPLAPFGNRVPQLSVEVVRPVGNLAPRIRSVCLIPGSTEFGYDTRPVSQLLGLGSSRPENVHQLQHATDVEASLDNLQALCPNLQHVSLVVSWFGDDLRAGHCTIAPRVELTGKTNAGATWTVAGLTRETALEVSRSGGLAAYGGTPSDESVLRLIAELKARGLAVTLYPFVMMDVPAGNDLPDPRTGAPGQPAYPWRGRITCDPAPGATGSVDGTSAAAAQVAAFFGSGAPAADEWSFRRLALHYAGLAAAAGGVDAFVIGSELVGLTRVRSAPGAYPAVAALRTLAADVRAIVGPATRLTYAADWTEYGSHVPAPGELRFPLDPLWADSAIDAVGIDYYPPLTDWRDGPTNLDAANAAGPSDPAYLRGRLRAGEAYDWFYADADARAAQVRSPITDGLGKPWVYRPKDLAGWWANAHHERVGGVELPAPTAWVPGSKPIWLTEIGVPAVDKGANGPNVFPDPKSAEGAAPPFSGGTRSDLAQARALDAIIDAFDPDSPGHDFILNPPAVGYSGHCVEPACISAWCWDARPWPAFPDFAGIWADGANWTAGHWLNGRLEGAPVDRVVAAILADAGLATGPVDALDGFLDGYVLDRPMSVRDALGPLARAFGFDPVASATGLRWVGRGGRVAAAIGRDDVVDAADAPLLSRTRSQETELPAAIELGFIDGENEYARASVGSCAVSGGSRRLLSTEVAIVTDRANAGLLAERWLQDLWAGREIVEFGLGIRALALEPADIVELGGAGGSALYRVTRITDGADRRVAARAVEPGVFTGGGGAASPPRRPSPPLLPGPAQVVVLDLPAAVGEPTTLQHIAVAADPWPGAVAVWRSADGASFALHRLLDGPAVIGRTLTTLAPGPLWRWDRAARLDVELSGPGLSTIAPIAALSGGNLLAVLGPDGAWEVVSPATATLIGPSRYRLSDFVRGLAGSEAAASRPAPAGSTLVRLDGAVAPLTSDPADLGQAWTYRVGPASRDHSDPSYVELTATAGPLALRPFAPVRVRARREPDGLRIDWTRRSRVGGDAWEPVDVPLWEEIEAYEVNVLDGGAVKRTLSAGSSAALYSAADELADWGSPRTTLTLRVAQLSRTVGRGFAATVTLDVG